MNVSIISSLSKAVKISDFDVEGNLGAQYNFMVMGRILSSRIFIQAIKFETLQNFQFYALQVFHGIKTITKLSVILLEELNLFLLIIFLILSYAQHVLK